jgi:phosphoglycerate dehydrogenase-like enzyme
MAGKSRVLISVGKTNCAEDVAKSLGDIAEVEYVSGDYAAQRSGAHAVIVGGERVDDAYLAVAPQLRIVARFGVGYDAVDVAACTRRRIYAGHTPEVLSGAVADLTWALILGWMRHLPAGDQYTRTEWHKRTPFPFGWDLAGKTLGILGLGRIGAEVAKRGFGFGLRMLYSDVIGRPDMETAYQMRRVDFETLLRESDILTVHVPLQDTAAKLLDAAAFRKMKRSALVVNTSRGGVIDQAALAAALTDGVIAGAALDVFEKEPIPPDTPLLKAPHLLVMPHAASATWETRRRMAERCVENVRACLEGRRPPFAVPEQRECTF